MIIGIIITFAVIAFVANALVDGYTENQNVKKWKLMLYKIIVSIILFWLLMMLGKCGCSFGGYDDTQTGETLLEHYEPR